jgi:hypothetical protein
MTQTILLHFPSGLSSTQMVGFCDLLNTILLGEKNQYLFKGEALQKNRIL